MHCLLTVKLAKIIFLAKKERIDSTKERNVSDHRCDRIIVLHVSRKPRLNFSNLVSHDFLEGLEISERAGFEPAVRFNSYNSLANCRFRPLSHLSNSPEGVGFEPTVHLCTTVFKTAAIDHSAIPPLSRLVLFRRVSTRKTFKISTHATNG